MHEVLHSLALTCILVYLHFTASMLHRVQRMQTHATSKVCVRADQGWDARYTPSNQLRFTLNQQKRDEITLTQQKRDEKTINAV